MRAATRTIIAALVAWRLAVELSTERPSSPDEHSLVLGLGRRGRRGPPGSYPNEPPRSHHGNYGLRGRYELPLKFVANPRDYLVNRWGTPVFCFVAGDDPDHPTAGPGLTTTGVPGSLPGPWELQDGTRLPLETYAGAEYRAETAVDLNPALTDDVVVVALVRTPRTTTAQVVMGTFNASTGKGWILYSFGGKWFYSINADTAIEAWFLQTAPGGLTLLIGLLDRGTNNVLWSPAGPSAAVGCPAGELTGDGIGIGARPDGAWAVSTDLLFGAAYYGPGIVDAWKVDSYARCKEALSLATGLEPSGNQAPLKGLPTFARASAASWQDDDGRWWIASSGLARAGDPKGARLAAARTNRCYNNINPQAITGWSTTTGVTPTAADDAAALATSKAEAWGPNVIEIDNSGGGGDSINWNGAAAGDTNRVSLSCLARIVAGSGARIGLVEPATEVFTDCGALVDGYATRTIVDNITPTATQKWAVKTPAGCKVRLIAYQHESNIFSAACFSTTPVPNWATGASAARAAETLTPPVSPRDARGRVSLGLRPLGWGGLLLDAGGACCPVTRSGGLDLIVGGPYAADAGFRTNDGTNTAIAAAPLVSDTRKAITVEWAGATQKITADGAAVSSAYDGGRPASGTYKLNSQAGEIALDSVVIEEAA